MKIRPWAKCASSLPTDEIESEDGRDFIQYGGKSVAEAIAEDLRSFGCVVEAPEHAHEHGWDCSLKYQNRGMWFQVTLIDDYWLVFEDTTFLSSLTGPHPIYIDFMERVGAALRADSRFDNLRWYVEVEDSESVGPDPVSR